MNWHPISGSHPKLLLALALGLLSMGLRTSPLPANPPSADQILEQVRNRDDGTDIYSEVRMVLVESNGSTRTRDLLFLEKDFGKNEKTTIYFTAPADVKGVALQSVNYDESSDQEDDQWMYLPAMRQTRRIAANDKRGSFMGSQYAYIDLDKLRVRDFTQVVQGEETLQGRPCHVIERKPVGDKIITKTGYHRTCLWVDKERLLVLKQTYFDARGVQFKELIIKRVEKIQGIWSVMESEMKDLVNRRSSSLIFSNVRYSVGLAQSLFQPSIMKTGISHGNLPPLR